ncbi:hypothetical protein SAMD00019534_083730 [Acytostelium subglobosum LB1]|uniref:hypothetical protein n=1 Tax=Acytostelium subglobosum LB1 TaxID=1410327 RepID=UPI000644FB3A|nr:hypothetical protein SAMD00019534_083730 [Acytostelium subglobosum LB1]GAM25198.1 hypothetical protein SAMD00019534_083730 [Acytostelium subglobosum LB1]|eukprot:XP_012751718.1 hypothetical protein SAMD00019534_083730 [Acytostelium subglobosum LB1]
MSDGSKSVAQVVISIETEAEIQQKQKQNIGNDNTTFKLIDFKQFAFKMCHNFVNYVMSFSGTANTPSNSVPIATVDRWYENFQKKLQNDALFWKD